MSEQKPTDPLGSMTHEIRAGWRRFWRLSWWWKGSAFAVIALIAVVVIATRGGGDGFDSTVFSRTPTPYAVSDTTTPAVEDRELDDSSGSRGPDLTGRWLDDGYEHGSEPTRYLDITRSDALSEAGGSDAYLYDELGTNLFGVLIDVGGGFVWYDPDEGDFTLRGSRDKPAVNERRCEIIGGLKLSGERLSGWVQCVEEDSSGDLTLVGERQDVSYTRSRGGGPSAPLYDSRVSDFWEGAVVPGGAARRELQAVVASGQQVIECQYGPLNPAENTGYKSYGFWYEDGPDNIEALLSLAPESGAPVPVSRLGYNSITSCPETLEAAERAH